jgi:hypothetical protein
MREGCRTKVENDDQLDSVEFCPRRAPARSQVGPGKKRSRLRPRCYLRERGEAWEGLEGLGSLN